MYPKASPDVTVQEIIDWACSGLSFYDSRQDSENEIERNAARAIIPLLIAVISICEGKDPLTQVKECMVKNN